MNTGVIDVYGTLSHHDGESPLNDPAIRDNPMEFFVVAADAVAGQAKYFGKEDIAAGHFEKR